MPTNASYFLIASRDPFDSNDAANFCELAKGLRQSGATVTLFLVQNGVLPARPSTKSTLLSDLAAAGVEVLADEFSLAERGIAKERLARGITAAPLDAVVDALAQGRKTMWH